MTEVYAAIELADGETPHGAIYRFMQASADRRMLFKELEVLDVMTIGPRRFVRFRTDQLKVAAVVEDICKVRAVILPNGPGYKVCLPGGRVAPVPTAKMHTAPLPNYKRAYRGPKNKLWKAQFQDI